MISLEGKVALVTGAASGIGAATADAFEQLGARVWRADIAEGVELTFDVTSEAGWSSAFAEAGARSGVQILVNAAGISRGPGAAGICEVSLEDWRRVFAVNVEGTLLGCQHAVRHMRRAGQGAIVNIASTAALAPSQALGAYGASKAAVLQLTRSVAASCAQQGLQIRCNAVLPGMVETPMTSGMPGDYRQRWLAQIPARRFGRPQEVAQLIAFLSSDAASYINAGAIEVDGGLLHRPIVAS